MNTSLMNGRSFMKTCVITLVAIFALVFSLGVNADTAEARIGGSSSEGSQSQSNLRESVDDAIADKTYTSSEGDTIKGNQLVDNGITTSRFSELTSKEQQRLIDDMNNAVKEKQERDIENDSNDPVTDNTVTNWLQELQQQPGVGSKLLGNITAQIKPDYVTGNRIFEPFSSPLNTAIALGVILLLVGITVTFVADMSYINVPIFQSMVANSMSNGSGGGGSGRFTNFFVGREALQAVEESENNSDGKYKNPNGMYLKKRIIGITLLGICLLFLIQGQIFDLVGLLMDLLGGFLD